MAAVNVDKIMEEVRANHALLDSCAAHDFSIPINRLSKQPIEPGMPTHFCDWKCSKCGGWVDHPRKSWYEKGMAVAMARLHWLHDCSTGQFDPQGYEWGIYRIKWENGKPVDVQCTLSDFTDLDAEMRREKGAA